MSEELTGDQWRSLLTEILTRRGATVQAQRRIRRDPGQRVVDLVAIRGNQRFLFEVGSDPATTGTISALLEEPAAKSATKIVVSPSWDDATRELAASSNVKLVKQQDLLSGKDDLLA